MSPRASIYAAEGNQLQKWETCYSKQIMGCQYEILPPFNIRFFFLKIFKSEEIILARDFSIKLPKVVWQMENMIKDQLAG